MRIIGVGDLVTDYYFVDGKFKGISGGMTSFNIISHLAKDFETYAVGVCGNDCEGDIAIDSLKSLGVNVDFIERKNINTRCFYISINKEESSISSKKSCPLCSNRKWYEKTLVSDNFPKNLLGKDTIVIIDTINKVNIEIANKVNKNKGRVFIDIGQIGNLRYLTLSELKEKLINKFDVVQLNERVSTFLVNKLKLENLSKLNEIFNSNIITVTHGKKGATFIYNDKSVFFETKNISKEVDPSGAGDSFYSEVIRTYVNNSFKIDDKVIEEAYKRASKISSEVVKVIGARGTLQKLYSKELTDACICGKNNTVSMKKNIHKKSLVNVANLESRLIRALESDAYLLLKKDLEENISKGTSIFIGAGGSRAAACFASRVVNLMYGCTTLFLNPRDLSYRNNSDVSNIYAFSYSGCSPDITYVVNSLNKRSVIISKKRKEKIVKKYTNNNIDIISYSNALYSSGRERGFLSFEGTIAPASLFAKIYYNTLNENISFEDFLKTRLNYWKEFFEIFFKENINKLKYILDKKNLLDIFYGDYTTTAALDLESKIVESGVYRVELHEKKNFSHGRFITNEHYTADNIIYFKTNKKDKYEDKLLEYLNQKSENVTIIKSDYEGLIAEFDLLLAVQFFISNISKMLNIDLSKPDYSEESMKLYRYSGEM